MIEFPRICRPVELRPVVEAVEELEDEQDESQGGDLQRDEWGAAFVVDRQLVRKNVVWDFQQIQFLNEKKTNIFFAHIYKITLKF
jgi:hypothetical protein